MTDKAITIRTGTSTDNVLLAEMGARTFYDTFAKDNTPADIAAYLAASFSPAKQADELADPANTFLIAEIEGIPVGYVRLHLSPPSSAITGIQPIEIVRFYSDQQWIGHGVGAALMSACLGFAIQKGCDTIWLDVWEHNPRAISFYRKWGFTVVGSQTFQLGSDLQNDLLMLRKVAPG